MSLVMAKLEELINEIGEDEIINIITYLNRTEKLNDILKGCGLAHLVKDRNAYSYCTYKSGKIVVLGDSQVKERILIAICKELGIYEDRIELCLDYDKVQTYDIKKLHYNTNYAVILVGAVPHSAIGKGKSRSLIAELESKEGYPPVIRLGTESDLKITKTNFKFAITKLIEEKRIVV